MGLACLLLVGCGANAPWARWTDGDDDLVYDAEDQCPDVPEDRDVFEDGDGCPDPDNDQDGRLDVDDHCPLDPEDQDGFQDEDGCPDPDNDRDGLIDGEDRCPDASETINHYRDEDGCPDEVPDTDGDGLVDDLDKCVSDPEDRDGFEDLDGCPDPDNDKDGILDVQDQCPMEPEIINGVDDDDGCPDRARVLRRHDPYCRGRLANRSMDETVYFGRGTAVPRSAVPLLKSIGDMLRRRSWVRIVIEGHTDNRGSASARQVTSLRRARAVRDVLLAAGARPGQIAVVGLGGDAPREDNRTRRGRAANRRVEFRLVRSPCETHRPDPAALEYFDGDGDGRIDPL